MSPDGTGISVPPDLSAAVEILCARCPDQLLAVIFFGSRLVGASPGKHSASDAFFVVDNYRRFYQSTRSEIGGWPWLMATINRILPPNIVYLSAANSGGVKAFIISADDFRRAMSTRSKDHFCLGRLSQEVAVLHARDQAAGRRIHDLLDDGRQQTLEWVPLYADAPFDARGYCRTMLRVSYGAEVRPESPNRVEEVFESEDDALTRLYTPVLDSGVNDGKLSRDDAGFRRAADPTPWERMRWRAYFTRSKVRATLRWSKYVVTFRGWPEYIAHKLERRTGIRIELSDAEKRWPLLLAWPKAARGLIALRRHQKQFRDDTHGGNR